MNAREPLPARSVPDSNLHFRARHPEDLFDIMLESGVRDGRFVYGITKIPESVSIRACGASRGLQCFVQSHTEAAACLFNPKDFLCCSGLRNVSATLMRGSTRLHTISQLRGEGVGWISETTTVGLLIGGSVQE